MTLSDLWFLPIFDIFLCMHICVCVRVCAACGREQANGWMIRCCAYCMSFELALFMTVSAPSFILLPLLPSFQLVRFHPISFFLFPSISLSHGHGLSFFQYFYQHSSQWHYFVLNTRNELYTTESLCECIYVPLNLCNRMEMIEYILKEKTSYKDMPFLKSASHQTGWHTCEWRRNAISLSNWKIQNEFQIGNMWTSKRLMRKTNNEQQFLKMLRDYDYYSLEKITVFFNFMQHSIIVLFLLPQRDIMILFTEMDYKMTT